MSPDVLAFFTGAGLTTSLAGGSVLGYVLGRKGALALDLDLASQGPESARRTRLGLTLLTAGEVISGILSITAAIDKSTGPVADMFFLAGGSAILAYALSIVPNLIHIKNPNEQSNTN